MTFEHVLGLFMISAVVVAIGAIGGATGRGPSAWFAHSLRRKAAPAVEEDGLDALTPMDRFALTAVLHCAMVVLLPLYLLLRCGEAITSGHNDDHTDHTHSATRPAASETTAAAGWYRDPLATRAYRWWTGTEWTDHAGDPLKEPPADLGEQPKARGRSARAVT